MLAKSCYFLKKIVWQNIIFSFLVRFETKPLLVDSLYYLDRILTVVFFLETCLKLLAMGIVAYFGNAW